jgi:hypothetical protein
MADGATNNRIEAIRSVLTLEALYEEASNICLKWVKGGAPAPAREHQLHPSRPTIRQLN